MSDNAGGDNLGMDVTIDVALDRFNKNIAAAEGLFVRFTSGLDKRSRRSVRELNRFAAGMNPAAAAALKLDRDVGRVNQALARLTPELQETTGAKAAAAVAIDGLTKRYEQQLATLRRAGQATGQMTSSLAAGERTGRRFGSIAQQMGYQIGDFAVQVASGQGALQALIQQGTQLIQIFGPIGAIAGAVGSVVGVLASEYLEAAFGAASLETATERLNDVLTAADSLVGDTADDLDRLAESYRNADEQQQLFMRARLSLHLADQRAALSGLRHALLEHAREASGVIYESVGDRGGGIRIRNPLEGFDLAQARRALDARQAFEDSDHGIAAIQAYMGTIADLALEVDGASAKFVTFAQETLTTGENLLETEDRIAETEAILRQLAEGVAVTGTGFRGLGSDADRTARAVASLSGDIEHQIQALGIQIASLLRFGTITDETADALARFEAVQSLGAEATDDQIASVTSLVSERERLSRQLATLLDQEREAARQAEEQERQAERQAAQWSTLTQGLRGQIAEARILINAYETMGTVTDAARDAAEALSLTQRLGVDLTAEQAEVLSGLIAARREALDQLDALREAEREAARRAEEEVRRQEQERARRAQEEARRQEQARAWYAELTRELEGETEAINRQIAAYRTHGRVTAAVRNELDALTVAQRLDGAVTAAQIDAIEALVASRNRARRELDRYQAAETAAARAIADAVRQEQQAIAAFDAAVDRRAAQVSDTVADLLVDGVGDGGRRSLDLFEDWLSALKITALRNAIVVPITTQLVRSMPWLFGVPGAPGSAGAGPGAGPAPGGPSTPGAGAGGFLDLPRFLSAPSWTTGSLGTNLALGPIGRSLGLSTTTPTGLMVTAGGGWQGSVVRGLNQLSSPVGMIGGIGGNLLGNLLFGSDRGMGADLGGMAGAAIGQILIPIPGFGAAVGALGGNFLGGLFGNDNAKRRERMRRIVERNNALGEVDLAIGSLEDLAEEMSDWQRQIRETEDRIAELRRQLHRLDGDTDRLDTVAEKLREAITTAFDEDIADQVAAMTGDIEHGYRRLVEAQNQRIDDAIEAEGDLAAVRRLNALETERWLDQLTAAQLDALGAVETALDAIDLQVRGIVATLGSGIDQQILASEAARSASEQTAALFRSVAGDLSRTVADLRGGGLSILSPAHVLAERLDQFDRLQAAAAAGDVAAMQQLPQSATVLLEAARVMHASGPAYVGIFERVQATLGGLAITADQFASTEERTAELLAVNIDLLTALRDELRLDAEDRDLAVIAELTAGLELVTDQLEGLPEAINLHLDLTGRIRDLYEPAILQQVDPAERIITETLVTLADQGVTLTETDPRTVPFTETLSRLADAGLDFTRAPPPVQVAFTETLEDLVSRGLSFTDTPLPQLVRYIESLLTLNDQGTTWTPVAADAVRTLREHLVSLSDQNAIWSSPAADAIRELRERLIALSDRGETWTPVARDAVRRLTEDLLSLAEQDRHWSVPAPDALRTLREQLVSLSDQGEAWSRVAADATRTLVERFQTEGGTLTEAQQAWLDLFTTDQVEQTRVLNLLATFDLDGSGALSLAEFLAGGGDRAQFEALDLNADRQLDIIELLADANVLSETGNAGQAILQRLIDDLGGVSQRTHDLLDRDRDRDTGFQTAFIANQGTIIEHLGRIAQLTEQEIADAEARAAYERAMQAWLAGRDEAAVAAFQRGRSAANDVAGLEGFWGRFKIPGAWISHVDWGGTDTAHAGHNRNNAAELERLRSFTETAQAIFRSIEEMTGGVISPGGWIGLQPGRTRFEIWGQESRAFEGADLRPVFEALIEAGLEGTQQVDPETMDVLRALDFADPATALRRLAEHVYARDNPEPILGFAQGGHHLGGLRLVGERGPELEATGPARIWSHDRTRDLLAPTVTVDLAPLGRGIDRLAVLVADQTEHLSRDLRQLSDEVRGLRADARHQRIRRAVAA